MMTEQEKMQKLFAAALRATDELETAKLTRAVPTPATAATVVQQAPAPLPVQSVSEPTVLVAAPVAVPTPGTPVGNAGLDDSTASELAALLDAQNLRKQRKHRRDGLIAALILLGLVGGPLGWLISSPERLKALREAINDIRSAGDITAIVAKYDAALERIKVRSAQVDDASRAMGVDPTKDDGKDPYLEKGMKEMAGGEGRTVGERNRILKEKFGSAKTSGKLAIPAPAAAAITPPPPGH